MAELSAGAARALTTPPLGIYLIGYGDRTGGARSVRDDLTATALVLSDGERRAVIISLDMLGLNREIVDRVRAGIELRAGIPGEHVLICCSHTHSGPVGWAHRHIDQAYFLRELAGRIAILPAGLAQPRGWLLNKRYIDGLVEKLVAITVQAAQTMAPATLKAGRGQAAIGHNRRERKPDGTIEIGYYPEGPVDNAVTVVQVVQEGRPLATVVNYTCHPVVLGPTSYAISADWVGAMRRHVEAEVGGLCLFIQGAAGDINPNSEWGENSSADVDRLGLVVGREVVRICGQLAPLDHGPIRVAEDEVWAHLLPPEGMIDRPIREIYAHQLARLAGVPSLLVDPLLAVRYPWNTTIKRREGMYQTPLPVAALRIGGWAVASLAMEPFVETGMAVKAASTAPLTMFAGYSGGLTGYLPTEAEHRLGGYEVEVAPYFYRLPGIFAPDTEPRVVERMIDLLQHV